jgi:hypothetical protein|tara:strand:- start:771 stop:1226 length:456 start_codon:yes stop_codon:yes gene_type:complete
MRKLTSSDLRDLKLLKHYRIIRKWACKTSDLNDADLELLIYLDALDLFTKQDFKTGTFAYSWDNRRWNRLLKEGWIVVWRQRNRTTQKYHIYKVSFKCKQLISRMYRIILGEEEIPVTERSNKIMKRKSYTDKVLAVAIEHVNSDNKKQYD